MNKKYLILENDSVLGDYLQDYIAEHKLDPHILYMVNIRDTDEIAEHFMSSEVLLFQPTLITWGQYNTMLMLMYDLITKGKLGIKEIQIFTHNDDIADDLKELWDDKRKYLDIVIQHVKIFHVDTMRNKEEIKL